MHLPDSARLLFRAFEYADRGALFHVFADPYARRFYPQLEDPQRIQRWIEWNLANYHAHGFGLWALERKDLPGLIGDCGLTYQDVEGRWDLEIGYHLHQSVRGQGYATEAALATLDYAFAHTNCDSVCSTVRPDNSASRAVASRVHSAQPREFIRGNLTLLLFTTSRREWLQRRQTPAL